MLCLLGICYSLQGKTSDAAACLAEAMKASEDVKSPQYLFSNALLRIIEDGASDTVAEVQNSVRQLLDKGKLATTATLLAMSERLINGWSDLLCAPLNLTVYVLDTSSNDLTTVRIKLDTIQDAVNMLLERLRISSIRESFPVIE